jgi:hypothetical protein
MTKKPAADQTAEPTEGAPEVVAAAPDAPDAAAEPAADQTAEAEPVAEVNGQQGDGQDIAIAATEAEVVPEAPSLANPDALGDAVIHHPAGATSCTFDGVTYDADEAGNITVPLRAVAALGAHGFVLVD